MYFFMAFARFIISWLLLKVWIQIRILSSPFLTVGLNTGLTSKPNLFKSEQTPLTILFPENKTHWIEELLGINFCDSKKEN